MVALLRIVLVVLASCALTASVLAKEVVVFVGAHPDDSEGFAGTAFLLREKYDVHVVDLTRGELGLGRAGLEDGSTAIRRMEEERRACALLGAKPHFLCEVDGDACAGRESVERLVGIFREVKPRAVFTHWPVDGHADHVQTAAVVAHALNKYTEWGTGPKVERYFFEVLLSQTANWHPLYSVDISRTMGDKQAMLRKYECQNGGDHLVVEKTKQAALRGVQRLPPCRYAETFATFGGSRIKGGVLEDLSETAIDRSIGNGPGQCDVFRSFRDQDRVLSADCLVVPCSEFEVLGGWSYDSQFRVANGFSYLIAHGLGKRVDDAMTTLVAEEEGDYDVWARTMNWTARWSEKSAAGTFKVAFDDIPLEGVLGKGSSDWQWQKAGRVRLAAGRHRLSLKDLTGFDGRCAAIALTRDAEPPSFPSEPVATAKTRFFDLVVAGGGVAGLCAAISAARSGLKTALVHNRAVLGGNNSSEIRVHMGGHLRCGDYPHLGDLVSELAPREGGNAREAAVYEDALKLRIAYAETNLTMFLETTVVGVEKDGDAIGAVRAVDDRTGRWYRLMAPFFVDATGDGALGAFAGADFRVGRESKAETGEKNAPENPDWLGMGSSCQWRAVRRNSPVAFQEKDWMLPFSDLTCTVALRGDWNWETGLGRDQIVEAERIRDYGMLVAYSNWAYVKNRSAKRGDFANAELEWVAYNAGKRESRRLLGDVILSETDIVGHRRYPDGTCLTSWSIDLHYPLTGKETGFKGESFQTRCEQQKIFLYPIPFGCLYSRNVPNLFMAGRDISVTHIALGTVRVMRTTGMMGEVVGMAAAVCKEKGCRPREVRERHFQLLAERMKKGVGKGLPMSEQDYNVHPTLGMNPDDPDDVARHRNEDWGNVDLYRKGK